MQDLRTGRCEGIVGEVQRALDQQVRIIVALVSAM
jgi:hypothetical protein